MAELCAICKCNIAKINFNFVSKESVDLTQSALESRSKMSKCFQTLEPSTISSLWMIQELLKLEE